MRRCAPLLAAGILLGSWYAPLDTVVYRSPDQLPVTQYANPSKTGIPGPSEKDRRAAATAVLDLLAKNLTTGQLDYRFNPSGDGVLIGAAGLAFIGSGSTLARGPYQQALARAFERVQGIMDSNNFPLQPTWGAAQSTIFLAELHRTAPSEKQPAIRALMTKYVEKLVNAQTSRGGWCHGFEDVKNTLNYDDLMATTVMVMQGLGMARREGVSVPQKTIDQGLTYIENSSNVNAGQIGYSPRTGQKGMKGSGRTAGGLLALSACGQGRSPLAIAAANYVQKSYDSTDMNSGHASAQLSQSWAAWWSAEAGQYPEFWAGQGKFILDRRKPDGGFNPGPSDGKAESNRSEQGDMANALHALMLVAGEGFLAAGEARSSPQAAITEAVLLKDNWGANVPKALNDIASLREREKPLTAPALAKELATGLKALAKHDDPRTAATILALLGPMPTYRAEYDAKARVIRVDIAMPAVRASGVAKATFSVEHRPELMQVVPAKKYLTAGTDATSVTIKISVRPDKIDDQPLKAEMRWNLAGLEHVESLTIPLARPTDGS